MTDPMEQLLSLGLTPQKAGETLKNETLTTHLLRSVQEVTKIGGEPGKVGTLVYHLCAKLKPQVANHLPLLLKYVVDNKLDSALRIDAALEYLLASAHQSLDVAAFEKECGIGVVVTPEDVESAVERVITKHKDEIVLNRYRFNTGLLLQEIRQSLRWADFKNVKSEIDVQLLDLLGPKTDADRLPPPKKTKEPKNKTPAPGKATKTNEPAEDLTISEMIGKLHLHKPGENFTTDGYVVTPNTNSLIGQHLSVTGGKVRTRFPPEPNGILHIGHAKAININFGYADYHKGVCFLRFDDTNPEKEEEKFFTGIMDMVEWLGYKPFKITHSSDYFDQLYEWAVKLIRLGLAYVCHQAQEDMQGFNPPPSPFRERTVDENLKLFSDMKSGKFKEGECTLRMKITLEEGKQDPVAYRIKYLPHPRTGNKWCIYPTYDYTHCLCDSIENITHSLCTKEFQSRRSSYYWLCNALGIYCPVQWEYGRLNMNYTVVSKRKIAKLISVGVVRDWDDPRLFTLSALRRRGFPAEAINRFCAQLGVTGAQAVVDPVMLESCVRVVLNRTAPRTMVVVDPLEVEIVSPHDITDPFKITVPDFPSESSSANHDINFASTLYIEMSDFKLMAEPGYKRFSKDQPVGLRYTPFMISVKDCVYQNDNPSRIKKLIVEATRVSETNKPKGFIHWVAKPTEITIRLYKRLFIHKNPEDPNEVPNGFLSDIVTDSFLEKKALADEYLPKHVKVFDKVQFERLGYFSVDPDTTKTNVVFNCTVTLKEDAGKK